jgi:hypothetical protein
MLPEVPGVTEMDPPLPSANAAVLVPAVTPAYGTVVALIAPEPLALSDAPVPTVIVAVVLVPLVIELNAELPPVAAFESFGASAESCALMLMELAVQVLGVFVLQLIAVVYVKLCAPVPAGGAIPGAMLTVNCHVVVPGTITPLSARRIEKLPAGKPFVVGQPSAIGDVDVLKPPPFKVGETPPAVTSCAEIVPQLHTMPSIDPVIVPVTVVKPP